MWKSGFIIVDGVHIYYEAKVYDVGSPFGINNGRVSKLFVWLNEDGFPPICHHPFIIYDRGWNEKPKNKYEQHVLDIILNKYKEA